MEQNTSSSVKIQNIINGYIDGVNGKLEKNNTLEEEEKFVNDFFENNQNLFDDIDFSDENVKNVVNSVLKYIFKKFDTKTSVTYSEIKLAHFLYAKSEAARLGIPSCGIHYLNRQQSKNVYGGAFFNPSDNSIYFKDITIFSSEMATRSSDYNASYRDSNSRKSIFADMFLLTTTHEFQHAKQQFEFNKTKLNPTKISPENYLMELQDAARMVERSSTKTDNAYRYNHDDFSLELDADYEGISQTFRKLRELDPAFSQIYENGQTTIDSTGYETQKTLNNKNKNIPIQHRIDRVSRLKKLEMIQKKLNTQYSTKWAHETNTNNQVIPSEWKASLLIDRYFPTLDFNAKRQIFKAFPELSLTRDTSCCRKSFDEIKSNLKNPNKRELYQKIIDCDPLYSLEFSIQKVIENSRPAETIKYAERAQKILFCLEQMQYKDTNKIISKYIEKIGLTIKSFYPIKPNSIELKTCDEVIKLREHLKSLENLNMEIRKAKLNENKKIDKPLCLGE